MDQNRCRERSGGVLGLIAGLLALIVLTGISGRGWSQELPGRIRLGPVRVQPLFSLKEEYSSNYFQTHGDEKGVYTTTMSPGIRLALPLGRNSFQMGWLSDVQRHSKFQTRLNTDTHTADGALNLNFPGGLGVGLSDTWRKTFAPPTTETAQRRDYYGNDTNMAIRYAFADRWRVELAPVVSQTRYHNNADRADNVVTAGAGGTLYYKFLPRTSALVEYRRSHDNTQNREEGDANNYNVNVGLSWDPEGKFVGTLKGGWGEKSFQNGLSTSTTTVETDVTYNMSSLTAWNLVLNRTISATSVSQGAAANGPYSVNTGGTLSVKHNVTSRIVANLNAGFFNNKYPDTDTAGEKRRDNRFDFGAGVGYRPQEWLGTGLNYTYTDNNSKIKTNSYVDQRVTFYVAFAY